MSELISAEYVAQSLIPLPYARIKFEDEPLKEQVKDLADRLALFLKDPTFGAQNTSEQQAVFEIDLGSKEQRQATKLESDPLEIVYLIQSNPFNVNYRVTKSRLGFVHIFTSGTCKYAASTLEDFIKSIKPKEPIIVQ